VKIFLSCRRDDSRLTAGRLAQFLDGIPAVESVFLDVNDIEIAENFKQKIDKTLTRSSHVFLLIGTGWMGHDQATGRNRISDPHDPVRQETSIALCSNIKIVPILIDEARMPIADELPEDLKPLSNINAFSLRTSHFDVDIDNLLDALHGKRKGRGSRWRQAPLTPTGVGLRAAAGLASSGTVVLAIAMANRFMSGDCYDLTCRIRTSFGITREEDAIGLLPVMVIGILVFGALAPFLFRSLRQGSKLRRS